MNQLKHLVAAVTVNAFLFSLLVPSLCSARPTASLVELDGKGDDLSPLDGDEQDVPFAIAELLDGLEVLDDDHVIVGDAQLRRIDDSQWAVWVVGSKDYEIVDDGDQGLVDTLVLAADLYHYEELDAGGRADVEARFEARARKYIEDLLEELDVVSEDLILVGDAYLERVEEDRWVAVSGGAVMGVLYSDGFDLAKELDALQGHAAAEIVEGDLFTNDDLLGGRIDIQGPDAGMLEVPPFIGELPVGDSLIPPEIAAGFIDMWMNMGADCGGGGGGGVGNVLDGISGILGALQGGLGGLIAALIGVGAIAAAGVVGVVIAIIALIIAIIEAIKDAEEKKKKEEQEGGDDQGDEETGQIWHPTGEEGPGSLLIDVLLPTGTLKVNMAYHGQYAY